MFFEGKKKKEEKKLLLTQYLSQYRGTTLTVILYISVN